MRVWQYKQMMPKKDKIKLAYLYFIPKSHKVIAMLLMKIFSLFNLYISTFVSLRKVHHYDLLCHL